MNRRRPSFHSTRSIAIAGAVLGLTAAAKADIYRKDEGDVISLSNNPKKGSVRVVRENAAPTLPRDSSPDRYIRYDAWIRQSAALYQIPEELVRAVIKVESDYDPRAVSRANARGLMQLIPETATRMTVTDVFDPRQNIFGGVRYLRVLANLFNGDLELTIAGYNAGENAVIRHGGIPPYAETQQYVEKVLFYYRYYRAKG